MDLCPTKTRGRDLFSMRARGLKLRALADPVMVFRITRTVVGADTIAVFHTKAWLDRDEYSFSGPGGAGRLLASEFCLVN